MNRLNRAQAEYERRGSMTQEDKDDEAARQHQLREREADHADEMRERQNDERASDAKTWSFY